MSTDILGFSLLADYFVRYQQHGKALPTAEDLADYWSGIGFVLDGHCYVVSITEVGEILTPPAMTRVPGVRPWFKGISNVRGRLMGVVDFSAFLNKPVKKINASTQRLLVIDDGDLYSGLVVDDILGLHHFSQEEFSRDKAITDEEIAPYVIGSYEREGERWSVVSLLRLAQDPKFLQVARTS